MPSDMQNNVSPMLRQVGTPISDESAASPSSNEEMTGTSPQTITPASLRRTSRKRKLTKESFKGMCGPDITDYVVGRNGGVYHGKSAKKAAPKSADRILGVTKHLLK